MLRELHIANLAVIQDVSIELGAGLNCFTGQTGAGKSLIMGALEILLGLRGAPGAGMLRSGASEARISGLFELDDPWLVGEVAQVADQAIGAGEPLLITRRLLASGRSSASINGQPATAAMVRSVGELLVDIHGRHDQQYLLKPSNQLLILDAFGQSSPLRQQYFELYSKLRGLETQRDTLIQSQTLDRQQLELYTFQADEIDACDPVAGEYHELKARCGLLSNLQRIKRDTTAAHGALYDSEGSILERLHMVARVLVDVAELDDELADVAEQVRCAVLTLQESAFELGRYADRLEVNGGELASIEDRLNLLNRLLAKYGGGAHVQAALPKTARTGALDAGGGEDPVVALLAFRQSIGQEIQRLRGQNEDLDQIDQQMAQQRAALGKVGLRLSQARRTAAQKLRPLVEAELAQLGMDQVRFEVAFEVADTADAGVSGLDQVEMLVQTNPGQPARPLRKIASSGELSRIMLALKSILAHSDRISVLVFDEIDANIGGRMGTVIGQKMRRLATGVRGDTVAGGHQVLCITHLPQIAAFADRHLRISKSVAGRGKSKQTHTTVSVLEGTSRVDELSEMLTGKEVTDTTRQQVHELLEMAGA